MIDFDQYIKRELDRFFNIYRSRTEGIVSTLPSSAKAALDEELDLLRVSIENRLTDLGV